MNAMGKFVDRKLKRYARKSACKTTLFKVLKTYFECKNCKYQETCKVRFNPERKMKMITFGPWGLEKWVYTCKEEHEKKVEDILNKKLP